MRQLLSNLVGAFAGLVPISTAIQFRGQDSDVPTMDLCWVHVPKCAGTTFRQAIAGYRRHPPTTGDFCVGTAGVSEHMPIPESVADSDLAHVVTMLRLPDQRLASTFSFVKAEMAKDGVPNFGWPFEDNTNKDVVQKLIAAGFTPANSQVLGTSYLGCQTNMLVGRQCMSGTPQATDVEIAKRRIDSIFWVGLEEEWRLSICLLNFKLTGERYIEKFQDTAWNDTPGSASWSASHYDTKGYPPDPYDLKLYQHAQERFKRDLAANDINPTNCYHTSDGTPLDEASHE
jgi:hypothetical protein